MAKNFNDFKKRLIECMVFQPIRHSEFYEMLNDWYKHFKETSMNNKTVENWCEFWFEEITFDTHTFMLKSKAIERRNKRTFKNKCD